MKIDRNMHVKGFTLIEIMVVMMIIGIITSFAMLSVNLNQSTILEDEVNRLRSLTLMASEEAVLKGNEMAVEMHTNGYRFLMLMQSDEAWQWVPVENDKLFRQRCFPPGLDMQLELEGEPTILERMPCKDSKLVLDEEKDESRLKDTREEEIPKVFLLSSGELTPFEAKLVWEDGGEIIVMGQLTGEVTSYDAREERDDI